MKVKLTYEEFRAILSRHFSCEVSEFEIVRPDPSPLGKIICQAVRDPFDKTYFIGNIKSLRNMVSDLGHRLTLAEARWAVDNWSVFIDFVNEYNRLPEPGYGSGEGKGKLI